MVEGYPETIRHVVIHLYIHLTLKPWNIGFKCSRTQVILAAEARSTDEYYTGRLLTIISGTGAIPPTLNPKP